jgi:hypothetical protein
MLTKEYRLVFEFSGEDGTRLGQISVEIDWEPAREWTRFLGIRRGLIPLDGRVHATAIEPLWNRRTGEPYLEGFRVIISGNSFGAVTEDFSTSYFHGLAREASGHFVEMGMLKRGECFQYLTAAYPDNGRSTPPSQLRFESEEVEPDIRYHATSLTKSMTGAFLEGAVDVCDMPIFIPRQILDEAEAITLSSQGTETGGILIGHLHRDEGLPEVFAEITAQIPARASGGRAKLSFNADTWMAVRAAVEIRSKHELYLGFWHSHPVSEWCKNNDCSIEKQLNCPLARGFFSQDDQALLRTVFPRAYSVGLVCSDLPLGRPAFSLFGWRRGMIESRGFHITTEKPPKDSAKVQ